MIPAAIGRSQIPAMEDAGPNSRTELLYNQGARDSPTGAEAESNGAGALGSPDGFPEKWR